MNLQFCSSPYILLFSLFIPGAIDVSVITGVSCCVLYPHVTPWGMFVEAIGETDVIHMYQFISLSIICACTHVATHIRNITSYWTLRADTERRITGHGDEMPQKAPRHHLQRPHLQRRGAKQNSAGHWAPRRLLDHSKTLQTEMVRARNKIFRACQDNHAGHSARREKTRQTEKEMGGQHPGMDGHDTGPRHEEG